MDFLNNLSGCELVTLSTIVSVYISKNLSCNEINTLANFFSSIGQNLTTISGAQISNSTSESDC